MVVRGFVGSWFVGSWFVVRGSAVPAGTTRDRAIDAWCESVWDAFRDSRGTIVELLREHGIP